MNKTLSPSNAHITRPTAQGAGVSILRRKAVEQITGLSRSSIYAMVKDGTLPAPIRLSANAVGWVATEIEAWIQDKIDHRK